LLNKKPGLIIEKAVKGMLPKTKLGRALFGNLFVYVGNEHPHAAQQPKTININDLR
jgi:large subunit ribosomal protein L13